MYGIYNTQYDQNKVISTYMYGIYNIDGDQDLTFWLRSLEDVLREILGDERMDGHQAFRFEMSRTEDGERQLGASNGAVSFQLALSLPPWAVAAIRTAAGRHGWAR